MTRTGRAPEPGDADERGLLLGLVRHLTEMERVYLVHALLAAGSRWCGRPLGDAVTGNRYSLRWNLRKVIGEYARHNGHADLIRERIDGATGE
jgi:Protein of unknown function (DUF664)